MQESNKALVRRFYEKVFNQRHLEAFDDLADMGFVSNLSGNRTINLSIYKQALAASLAAMPDLKVVIDDQIAEADKVVTRWTAHGTPTTNFAGIAPSGKAITVTAIHIHRIKDGKLIEHWEAINLHAVVQS
jgi:steroid delta-isomerase-like uncharacterized protein